MMQPCLCGSVLISCSLLVACNGSGSQATGSSANAADFCNSFTQAFANIEAQCVGGSAAYWSKVYASILDCGRVADAVSAGQLTYDSSKGAECLTQVSQMTCDQTGSNSACTTVIVGHFPSGGSCSADVPLFTDCAPGNYCASNTDACGATCKAYAYAQLGASCGYSSTASYVTCDTGLGCQSTALICVADVTEGQPCEGTTAGDCATDLYCEGATTSTSGVCRKKKTAGACVASASQCASGYSCVGSTGTQTCTKLKYPGDACTQGFHECATLSWCGNDNKCTDIPAQENQPCLTDKGEYIQCATGLYCATISGTLTTGTCQKKKAEGGSCTYSSQCAGTGPYCDSKSKLCVSCN